MTTRIRRSKDASRLVMLEAAEQLMLEEGPDAVRVQRVAAVVGVTDAAVHYHFKNRAGLIEALLRHCGRKLVADIEAVTGSEFDLAAISRAMRLAYEDRGAGRMAMWLKLAGWRPRGRGMLASLIEGAHEARCAAAEARGAPEPDIVETRRVIALFNAAHIAMAIMGDALLPAADLAADETGQDEFLKWVTELLGERLDRA